MNLFKFFEFIKDRREDLESFEDFLLLSGFGIDFSQRLMKIYKKGGIDDVKKSLYEILEGSERDLKVFETSIYLFLGVNGGGKTTSIAKLGNYFKEKGEKVLFIQGDTFRTGANEQLKIWGERIKVEVFSGRRGDDPGSVIYDGLNFGLNRGFNKIFIDTAGRLETKKNLILELKKIKGVIEKNFMEITETILIIDSTEGENIYSQVEKFNEAMNVTGLFITKIDSTIKPGILFPVYEKYKIPILFLSYGEDLRSFEKFERKKFIEAIFKDFS